MAEDARNRSKVPRIFGNPNFGPDSPLYGATGRKRKSEYASGLTRKKKSEPTP